MANGIFLIGSIEAFPVVDVHLGQYLAFLLFIVWMVIYSSLTIQFFQRAFIIPFLKDPVKSFAVGTWIAGVSVLCNVFLKYFPNILSVTKVIALINTSLWAFFLILCIWNFKQLINRKTSAEVHGILLLATVGTQSIIVLLNNVYASFPTRVSNIIILLGCVFYVVGMFLIVRRYAITKGWSLADDWKNTNCIIHGALSITGLAIVSSQTFSGRALTILWLSIFILVLIIESIEVVRAAKRIKQYGWRKGIFTYHVTQWSRNFTFGMFYTFTIFMHQSTSYVIPQQLYKFQKEFMIIWAWVVLVALIVQIAIYIHSHFDVIHRNERKRFTL